METQCIRILIVFYMFKANPVNGIGMNYNNKSLANEKQTTKNEPTLIDHIRRHLLNRYSITVNLIVITFLKLSEILFHFITWNQFGVIDSWWLATHIKKIMRRNLSSRISLGDIFPIYWRCWNIATSKWKVHNQKAFKISFVNKNVLNWPLLPIAEVKIWGTLNCNCSMK